MAGSPTRRTAAAKTQFERLVEKGIRYWLSVLGVLALSILATPYIENYLNLVPAKYWLFQKLIDLTWSPPVPRFVKVVLVGDDEYWRGYPAGRRPIKRDYLGRLVDALDFANAGVIAVDFDVRLPDPDSMKIPPDYKRETDQFISSILRAAEHRKIVLAKTIWFDSHGGYRFDRDIYQPYGICVRLDGNKRWETLA